jgi:hypothetical protein
MPPLLTPLLAALSLAAIVLAGCGGPAEIAPATPSAEEIRESERALEAAAAAEKSLPEAPDR